MSHEDAWADFDVWTSIEVTATVDPGDEPEDEPIGSKRKFWTRSPTGDRWLFKYARVHDGIVRGEDWAECAVHQVGNLLGVPTATVRLAHCDQARGIVSRSVVTPEQPLILGNELMAISDSGYDRLALRENPRYTPAAVKSVLTQYEPVRPADSGIQTAFDQWVGYLVLDALVAGRDRHHRNWAVMIDFSTSPSISLAPSFDHGNALGFQEPERQHERLSQDPEALQRWARKGRSPHFAGRPTLVEVAHEALKLASPLAARMWLARVDALSTRDLSRAVEGAPHDVCRRLRVCSVYDC